MLKSIAKISMFALTLIGPGFASFAASPPPKDPIFIVTKNGFKGLFPGNEEYVEFSLPGKDVKVQDPYHIILKSNFGMMLTFVSKNQLGDNPDLLSAHAQWELGYWIQKAGKAQLVHRDELRGSNPAVKVSEIDFTSQGPIKSLYLIGLLSKDGVYVFSISPAKQEIDAITKEIIASIKLIPKTLDIEEVKRLSEAEKDK